MKLITTLTLLLYGPVAGLGQTGYWQQAVNYDINVTLDVGRNTLKGFETITYTNNSPDTLSFIWFHIWPNAYRDKSSAFYKQLVSLKDGKNELRKLKFDGFVDSLDFKISGRPLKTEPYAESNDVIRLLLDTPLLPGNQTIITTPFFVKIPSYISRMGYRQQSYLITQWYPKPAVYDKKGWHPIAYLDMGEFYSEFGNFKINISLPDDYVVAATGILETEKERNRYQSIGKKNKQLIDSLEKLTGDMEDISPDFTFYSGNPSYYKTLTYTAEHVHDFAWFADKRYVINYDTLQLSSGKIVDAYSFYHPSSGPRWYNSENFVEDAVRHYSNWIGEYAYPSVIAVDGPENNNSGGMEYPMITLITSPESGMAKLDGIIAHEVGHNWFYGMLGSNEREHPWMDEGINTYYEFKYEAEKYRSNLVFGGSAPEELRRLNEDDFLSVVYNQLNKNFFDEPIESPATRFTSEADYSMTIYLKTAIWMYELQLSVGASNFEKAMKAYFAEWKFKHPYPEDMQVSMENSIDTGLQDLFLLLRSTKNF